MHWNGWGMSWMWIYWVIVCVAIVALVVFLARFSSSSGRRSPEEILKERYARGEISKAQYEEQLKTLRER